MCHLIADPSVEVQKMAYQMLHKAAKKRTEFMVVEAGVDAEGTYQARLPDELLATFIQDVELPESEAKVDLQKSALRQSHSHIF